MWAGAVCASGIQPCVLQKMGQRRVTSTYLSSIPSVARRVHQRRMAHWKCFGVCVGSPGTQRGGFFPRGVQAGLCVLCAQEVVTTKGSVPGVRSPQKWPVSFGSGFGPVATVSWGGCKRAGGLRTPGLAPNQRAGALRGCVRLKGGTGCRPGSPPPAGRRRRDAGSLPSPPSGAPVPWSGPPEESAGAPGGGGGGSADPRLAGGRGWGQPAGPRRSCHLSPPRRGGRG